MKLAAASLFLGSLFLAIVVSAAPTVNSHSSRVVMHPVILADGGAPAPPFPGTGQSVTGLSSGSVALADGGAPAPPFPGTGQSVISLPNGSVTLADGGAPAPPFPGTGSSATV